VVERNKGLFCDGVMNVGTMGYEWTPGYPGISQVGGPPAYELTIRDPGHIIVSSPGGSYALRGGTIRRLSPYWALNPVRALHGDFVRYIKAEITRTKGSDASALFGGIDRSPLTDGFFNIVSRMLRVAVESRHGGAFVILPPDSDSPATLNIHMKYPASELDLGLNAISFWLACVEYAHLEAKDQSLLKLKESVVCRTKMLTEAEVCGNFSSVDGCVVLNRHLQLRGFGGEILVSEEQARQSTRAFRNIMSGEEWPYEEFMKGIGGTRHKSAARLCKAHPGILVFTISQDGDLKLFCSDQDQVNGFGPLDVPLMGERVWAA
jgi:hypothetical protein